MCVCVCVCAGGSCPDFKWEYPFPERSGISEAQLGYTCTSDAVSGNHSALSQLDEIRSRTGSQEEQTPKHVCLAAIVQARITEVDRQRSHDEYIICVERVSDDEQAQVMRQVSLLRTAFRVVNVFTRLPIIVTFAHVVD